MIDHYNYEDNKIKDYVNERLVQLKVNEIPTYTNGIHMNKTSLEAKPYHNSLSNNSYSNGLLEENYNSGQSHPRTNISDLTIIDEEKVQDKKKESILNHKSMCPVYIQQSSNDRDLIYFMIIIILFISNMFLMQQIITRKKHN